MYCPNCGKLVSESDEYCPNCGYKLKKLSQAKPQVKSPTRLYASAALEVVAAIALIFCPLYELAFHTERSNLDILFSLGEIHSGFAVFALFSIWGIAQGIILAVHAWRHVSKRGIATKKPVYLSDEKGQAKGHEVMNAVSSGDGLLTVVYALLFLFLINAIRSDVTYYVHPSGWIWVVLILGVALLVLDVMDAVQAR